MEILLAAGDVAGARTAIDALSEIVAGYPSPALEAGRLAALGRVLVAEGDATGATRELRTAIRGWRDVGAPYEVARARAVLSSAYRALDDDEVADTRAARGARRVPTARRPDRCRSAPSACSATSRTAGPAR